MKKSRKSSKIPNYKSKLLKIIKKNYPEFLDNSKKFRSALKEYNDIELKKEANNTAKLNLWISGLTLLIVFVGGYVTYNTFLSQQPEILPTVGSYCPYIQTLNNGQTFFNFTFSNSGQTIGNINVTIDNSSISAFLTPFLGNLSLSLSGGQLEDFRIELDELKIPPSLNYNFSINARIDNGARGKTCLIQTCSYSSKYNASKYPYNSIYFQNLFQRVSKPAWTSIKC